MLSLDEKAGILFIIGVFIIAILGCFEIEYSNKCYRWAVLGIYLLIAAIVLAIRVIMW